MGGWPSARQAVAGVAFRHGAVLARPYWPGDRADPRRAGLGHPASRRLPASGRRRSREDRLFGRVFTFASLATVLLLMARVTKHAADPLDNTDMWFHLKLGHEFLGGWSLRHPGQLSSFATSPWVPTQWSTEILTAKVDDWFGLPGVAWMFGLLYLVLIVAVFFLCRATR